MDILKLSWRFLAAAAIFCFHPMVQAEEGTLEEVIVTAQRVEQSLQEVPLAISAFSADSLSEQQI